MARTQLNLAAYVVRLESQTDFAGWRDAARRLATNDIPPEDVAWQVEPDREDGASNLPAAQAEARLVVPRDFIERAETAICHCDPDRFGFLYRLLWRLRSEPKLLSIATDPDIRRLEAMEKAVHRDI
ncbi:MAG: uracil-DNA glycosylase, partial [Mesorhizobium sp.]